ncbi:SDR family NAD(P)-dependent oxidoreductase [uncultured Sphingomonas sp.]|uniref:SDR family NAD(P)-dependent oxidoreductase n=1 Tax=uncultured Sphingomonas sp. TaxID=158754 RepID=UPI0035CABA57
MARERFNKRFVVDLHDRSIERAGDLGTFHLGDHGRLDILVNNAAIVDTEDGPPTASALEAARRIMNTNFVGTLAMTQAMLPLLRQAPAARIVNLSSSLGSLTLNGDPASPYYSARLIGYNASKAALNMLTVQLAEELCDTPIVRQLGQSGLREDRPDRG